MNNSHKNPNPIINKNPFLVVNSNHGKKTEKKRKQSKTTSRKKKLINQLDLTHDKKQINESEEDNESININQIEPKKNKKKIDSNTLATTYFSQSSIGGNNLNNSKVIQL